MYQYDPGTQKLVRAPVYFKVKQTTTSGKSNTSSTRDGRSGPSKDNTNRCNQVSYIGALDLPVKTCSVTGFRQLNEPEPEHSAYSQQLYERLVEPHVTGALASMVRAPNVRQVYVITVRIYVKVYSYS